MVVIDERNAESMPEATLLFNEVDAWVNTGLWWENCLMLGGGVSLFAETSSSCGGESVASAPRTNKVSMWCQWRMMVDAFDVMPAGNPNA